MSSESQPSSESSSSASEPVKRGRGRPKGSKNKNSFHVHVRIIPAQCPACNGTEYKVQNQSRPDLKRRGNIHGFEYNTITWRRVICLCGNAFTAITYRNIPPTE